MDLWNALAGVGAVAAVGVAIWAVIVAHRANAKARRANELSDEANGIAKAALKHQKRIAPPVWSQVSRKSESQRTLTNNSGRHIAVTSSTIAPNHLDQELEFPDLPLLVENGDEFVFRYWSSDFEPTPDKLTLQWHFIDDPESAKTTTRGLF